jgi:hypothetical protein
MDVGAARQPSGAAQRCPVGENLFVRADGRGRAAGLGDHRSTLQAFGITMIQYRSRADSAASENARRQPAGVL